MNNFGLRSIILEATRFTTQCKTRYSKSFTLFSDALCLFIYLLELVRSEKRIPIKEALMKTHILMYRSEKNRQIDIIDLKPIPRNDRVHFEAQNYSSLLQNSPRLLTSNCDRHFLPLQNNQDDRHFLPLRSSFLRCNRSPSPFLGPLPLNRRLKPIGKQHFQPIDIEQSRAFRSDREEYRPLKYITLTGCWITAIDEKG